MNKQKLICRINKIIKFNRMNRIKKFVPFFNKIYIQSK